MAARKRKAVDDGAQDEMGASMSDRAAPTQPPVTSPVTSRRPDSYYRNLYSKEPDFQQLGKRDADFFALLKSNGQLDFTDPRAVMQLTKTLLRLDFGLKIDLPFNRLCPPVPNRHNYILWLKELMDSSSYSDPGRKLSGLDVGTGASCIYPLLGTAQRPWCFVATDIDSESLGYARKNVELNGLEDRIRLVARKAPDSLILLDDLGINSIDFTMTNPPFYFSQDEMVSSAKAKARPPHSACTGAPVEMVCEGGELAFVGRMLAESLVLRDRVQWYTSMFGKGSSIEVFVERLRQNGIDNFAVTEFIQGNKTRRWAVGWSFGAMRPAQDAARGMKGSTWKKLLPAVVEVELYTSPSLQGVGPLVNRIAQVVGVLELISWEWEPGKLRGIGRARENVWSRAWRRKKLREKADLQDKAADSRGTESCVFGFLVALDVGRTDVITRVRWVEGHDEGLFESFSGFLKRRLGTKDEE